MIKAEREIKIRRSKWVGPELLTVKSLTPFWKYFRAQKFVLVLFLPLVINHSQGIRIWPRLAQDFITQVMINNLGYEL